MNLFPNVTWYKDAIIYEVHVRAFFDSVTDGIGDFGGLTQKLDYLEDLGVTATVAAAVLPVAATRRRLRHLGLHRRPSLNTARWRISSAFCARRTGAVCGSSPSWC